MKTPKSCQILHRADKQLLHERVRNINNSLHVWALKRQDSYYKLRALIKERNLHNVAYSSTESRNVDTTKLN